MLINFLICSWYHENLKRDKAEDMLKRVRKNGAFLVRKKESDQPSSEHGDTENQPESQNEESSFAISFRYVVTVLFQCVQCHLNF